MTRTARATFPRAIIKDRSESKSGLDKSIRKNGAGHHNWGSIADEQQLEFAALDDEELELVEENELSDSLSTTSSEPLEEKKPNFQGSMSALTEEELASARKFRKNALKTNGLDLAAIARTSSAVSTSPTAKSAVSITSGAQTLV